MLVTFSCPAHGDVTMFGDVAIRFIEMMGHSGTVPSALLADDVPTALEHLTARLAAEEPPPTLPERRKLDDDEPAISLQLRAGPLLELLEAAKVEKCDVMWHATQAPGTSSLPEEQKYFPVKNMSARHIPAPLGSEFDAFLFASIGDDENGLSLSVVSALARMNLDPWQEAAALAALPADTAAQKVTALFATFPEELLSDTDRSALTARLIELLPRLVRKENKNVLPHGRYPLSTGTIILAVVLLLLAAQIVFAQQLSPTPAWQGQELAR